MKKFKLTKQRIYFRGDEEITESNRTEFFMIESESFKRNRTEIKLTNDNIEYAKKYLNPDYSIGDVHYSPIMSISFYDGELEKENINIFADPYYKLEEFIKDEWVIVDKHKCHHI